MVEPGTAAGLKKRTTDGRDELAGKSEAKKELAKLVEELALLHNRLYAEGRRNLLGRQAANANGHDVLVMRAVEDPDLTALRTRAVEAPEVVVCELGRRRFLERDDPAALGVDPGQDTLDRPVLAGGVEALQHQ